MIEPQATRFGDRFCQCPTGRSSHGGEKDRMAETELLSKLRTQRHGITPFRPCFSFDGVVFNRPTDDSRLKKILVACASMAWRESAELLALLAEGPDHRFGAARRPAR